MKFAKAIAVVVARDAVARDVDVTDRACLNHEFPKDGVGDLVVELGDVNRGIGVAVCRVAV